MSDLAAATVAAEVQSVCRAKQATLSVCMDFV